MKITQVYRTRNGVVGPTSINGYGIIKVNGLRYDEDENKYYDSEDNEVILEEGREYYSNNKLYVYDGKLTQLLTDLMIEVKWAELVKLRDNGELIPGMKYRITDVTNAFPPDSEYYGKQIDVIVEATSTNTLYEEAQAAMHENIYDVTFEDGVTKKCYLYCTNVEDDFWNIVELETMLGWDEIQNIEIDESTKTINAGIEYDGGGYAENLTYNYFQNYNLSNWKVYYCLDNDKAKFSWADDSVDEDSPAFITFLGQKGDINTLYRDSADDLNNLFAWKEGDGFPYYTASQTPNAGDTVYYEDGTDADFTVNSFTPAHESTGLPNGRGVIYEVKTVQDNNLIKVTWRKLKDLRDNGKLIAGKFYRITDYQCTTTQHNTQSAGHQFDIVLLALSENELAEEGWAMIHDNIYDVTFSDGVTKKCYLNVTSKYTDETVTYENWNVVDVNTMLGVQLDDVVRGEQAIVDDNTKTIVFPSGYDINSSSLIDENLPYNYFQNSNLSAWKVWYCLDNDKSRFAWADNSVEILSGALVNGFPRNVTNDAVVGGLSFFCWGAEGTNVQLYKFTRSETPSVGDTVYKKGKKGSMTADGTVNSYTPPEFGDPNGRGVIYRLIDEWNNDVPYDFKNMMFEIPVIDGYYDDGGTLTYVYTFSAYDTEDSTYKDGSMLSGILLYPDDVLVSIVKNNTILGLDSLDRPVILLDIIDKNNDQPLYTTRCFIEASGMVYLNRCKDINIFYSNNVILSEIERSTFYNCNRGISTFTPDSECVMIKNKNVLIES